MIILEQIIENEKAASNEPHRLEFKAYRNMDKDDGINHIRIDKHAQTSLGKRLCTNHTRTFFHPDFGSFISIQSAIEWFRLKHKDDTIRELTGKQLTHYIENQLTEGKNEYETKNVGDDFMYSVIFYSLMSKPELLEELSKNKLPFCYYHMGEDGYSKVRNIHYTNCLTRIIPYLTNNK